ncbi:MAG: DUF1049 domain-containing protein [Nitrospira sp.]|nr:DUF1049 domain-containing protein [Nitrospira sp.]
MAPCGQTGGAVGPPDPDDTGRTGHGARPPIGHALDSDHTSLAGSQPCISITETRAPCSEKEFGSMIRLILVGILLLLSLAFFLQNQEQKVTLRYFFGLLEASTPVYKPIMAGFVVGLLVAGLLLFPPWIHGRIELRRKTKALQEADVDLERLRQSLEKATDRTATPASSESPQSFADD